MYHSTYRGCVIWRNSDKNYAYALRWTCNVHGTKIAADTLAGLKRMITAELA